ncbi:MAG: DUF3108 domain-containing protein [Chthoniobacterales bacterium]
MLIAQKKQSKPAPAQQGGSKKAEKDADVPFKTGEKLNFQVLFSKFTVKAGALEFAIVEHRDFFGRSTWHLRATAHSVDTVRALYALDDQFDSYTDAARLTTLQYEMYLREAGKKEDHTWRMDTGEDPVPNGVTAARVVPGTRDPLGFLYVLRTTDWKKTNEVRSPVFDGQHLYDVQAQLVQPKGSVTVPNGHYNASQVRVRVFQNGKELKDTGFSVWLADDSSRTPVLIEADLPVGSARVELTGKM